MESPANEPVVAYLRVSRIGDRADTLISPEIQFDGIERLSEREGYRVVKTLTELDASGGDRDRPKWQEAQRIVEQGQANGIVVYNLSRFSRSQVDAIDRLKAAGGFLHSVQEGQFDDSPAGTLLRDTLFRFAQFERDRATEGFRLSIDSAVARGVAVMGVIPLGYLRHPVTRVLVIDPETGWLIVEIFTMRAAGQSHDRIAKWLTSKGYPKNASGVRYLLKNRTYLGEMRSGTAVNPDAHEPLVSQRLFDAANSRNVQRIVGDGSLTNRVLLQGLTTCASCGHSLSVTSSRHKGVLTAAYYCRSGVGCLNRAWVRADVLDAYVESELLDYLELLDLKRSVTSESDDAELAARLDKAESVLADREYDLRDFSTDLKARKLMGNQLWHEFPCRIRGGCQQG